MGNMGTDQSAGLPEEVVEPVFPVSAEVCCYMAYVTWGAGHLAVTCPIHGNQMIKGGKLRFPIREGFRGG